MPTINLNEKNMDENIKSLIKHHKDLIIESTTYTTKIKLPNGTNYLFAKGMTSKATLIAAQIIKKELKDKHFEPFNKTVAYFNFSEDLPEYLKECVCIDIDSAYATELKNLDLITPKTFERLNRIKKSERLKSLGMLATTKIIQTICEEQLIGIDSETSPTAPVFFEVAYNVGKVLNELFFTYPNYVYFFWVDGIFVRKEIVDFVIETIESAGFKCKIEPVKELYKKDNYLIFDKWNNKKQLFEKKILFMPKKRNNRVSKEIYNFVTK